MKSIEDWKSTLRAALREAMRAKQAIVSVLRELLSALDNAESVDLSQAPPTQQGVIAGSVAGLGAGDVPRRVITPEEVSALVAREIQDRRDTVATYRALGQGEEADTLQLQLEALARLGVTP